ncbi:MAG: hypothetical protein GZ091_14795 [Paludibacter sp.]|nr:hypothetical protein [Paludibacter sp.]
MKTIKNKSDEAISLRRKAENKLLIQAGLNQDSQNEAENAKLLHELQVHQIELEMQNDELKKALENTATATALYDFAPAGYFTLDRDSTISQMNLNGAKMLGKSRSELVDVKFILFVSTENLGAFNEFLKNVFDTEKKQTCEFELILNEFLSIYVEGIISEDDTKCYVTAVDITKQKLDQAEITKQKLEETEKTRKIAELEYYQNFLVGRELKMIELKKEINELLKELNRNPEYKSVE